MESDTQKLLVGIGQPDFAYRSFDNADAQAVIRKWPLVEHLAGSAALRTALGPAKGVRAAASGVSADPAGRAPAKAGFLKAYGPADPPGAHEQSGVDVRVLLGRLAKDMS